MKPLLAAALLCAGAPLFAQSATLTKDDGRPLIVGDVPGLGADLTPAAQEGAALVAEFRRLCLPDPAGAAARVTGSPLGLASADAVLPAEDRRAEARVAQWRGPSALLSVWDGGDAAALRGRPVSIPSRGAMTTGPYGPFRAEGAQCNLVAMLRDFTSVPALADALTAAFGEPGKVVVRRTFADGHWAGEGGIRINLNAPSVRAGGQPVHLSAQIIAPASR